MVAPITLNFIGGGNPVVWAALGSFDLPPPPCLTLPFMETPKFLCFTYTKAIFMFHIGVGWYNPLLGTLFAVKTPSGLVLAVFTLSCHATWPFPPETHLNFSVSIIKRLYLCSTLVFGGNTHYLELYWMLETLCLDRS